MKKLLALAVIAPLLISCSEVRPKGETYNEALGQGLPNGFDILMGQFASNIENLCGDIKGSPDRRAERLRQIYRSVPDPRSHINFDDGTYR